MDQGAPNILSESLFVLQWTSYANSHPPSQWPLSTLSALQHFRQNMNTKLLEVSIKTETS